MLPDNDDGPSDPKKYRRSLLPLEFEDAEEPPSFGRRLTNLFRRKDRAADSVEEESQAAAPPRVPETAETEAEDHFL